MISSTSHFTQTSNRYQVDEEVVGCDISTFNWRRTSVVRQHLPLNKKSRYPASISISRMTRLGSQIIFIIYCKFFLLFLLYVSLLISVFHLTKFSFLPTFCVKIMPIPALQVLCEGFNLSYNLFRHRNMYKAATYGTYVLFCFICTRVHGSKYNASNLIAVKPRHFDRMVTLLTLL